MRFKTFSKIVVTKKDTSNEYILQSLLKFLFNYYILFIYQLFAIKILAEHKQYIYIFIHYKSSAIEIYFHQNLYFSKSYNSKIILPVKRSCKLFLFKISEIIKYFLMDLFT